jgi:hypothetical protein
VGDLGLQRITTTIERSFLAAIIAGTKKVEYRELKPYWTNRLSRVKPPFELRLINGMQAHAPEVTVVISKVRTNRRAGEYELHISRVGNFKNWNKRKQQPARRGGPG